MTVTTSWVTGKQTNCWDMKYEEPENKETETKLRITTATMRDTKKPSSPLIPISQKDKFATLYYSHKAVH